jgi:hypothetical protein
MVNEFPNPYHKAIHGIVLDRFLPPYYEGSISALLQNLLSPGKMLFDPFGSHPLFALEAARSGFTVLVSSHNPILNLALKVFAIAPEQADFNRALAAFSTIKRGDEFLEQHLNSLYLTQCPICKEATPASAYLWQKHASVPTKKIITCNKCHQSGEYEIDHSDIQTLEIIGGAKLHQARALSSVADPDDALWQEIEQWMEIFPLRSLYTIINMANRIKGSIHDETLQLLLNALLINFCDYGNTLWDPENVHFRPKQLNVPSFYKEYNPWYLIPEWVTAWKQIDQPIPITTWPDISNQEGGSICLMPYRLKDSVQLIKNLPIKAVIGLIPRPSNAFWTLSAFWTGWLFGKPAVKNMAFAFTRKRYDWKWHANVLSASFNWVNQAILPSTPRILAAPELTPGFVSALFSAGYTAGWEPIHSTLNAQEQNLYSIWKAKTVQQKTTNSIILHQSIQQEMLNAVEQVNEPVPYLSLHTLYGIQVAKMGVPSPAGQEDNAFQNLQDGINAMFKSATSFYRLKDTVKEKQSGYWWLTGKNSFDHRLTQSERMEAFTSSVLWREKKLHQELFLGLSGYHFQGIFTPSVSAWMDYLEAYATPIGAGLWQLAENDIPENRAATAADILEKLTSLGKEYEYTVQQKNQQIHWEKNNQRVSFTVISSGICSPFFPEDFSTGKKINAIIFPGSKSKLVSTRLLLDPRYQHAVENCHLIKYRHILRLLQPGTGDIRQFLQALDDDQPDVEDMRQMSLFG